MDKERLTADAEAAEKAFVESAQDMYDFMGKHEEIFEEFFQLLERRNDAVKHARDVMSALAGAVREVGHFGYRTTPLRDGYDPEVLRQLAPDILMTPGVVAKVYVGPIRKLVREGRLSKDIAEAAITKTGGAPTIDGPDRIEFKVE
mgnify:CR=1 FL=1